MAGLTVKAGRGVAAALTLVLLQAPATPPAVAGIFGGGSSAALGYCAAERAPLVDLQKQYDQLERSRMGKSVGVGAMAAGATLLSGLGGGRFGSFGGNSGSSSGGLSIFGGGGGSRTEQVMTAVAVGVFASVATYVALKSDGINDRRSLALAVDNDARSQVGVGRTTAQSARALTACRQRQIADFQTRAAAAPSPKSMAKEKADITDAVKQDIALTDKVVGRQADLAKTFTQARAMAEGSSESQVLGGQTAAFQSTTATQPQQLPSNSPLANQPPPPKPVQAARSVVTTIKATPVRAAPSAKAKVLATLPARHEVTPAEAEPTPGWTPVMVDGQTGYVRAVSLSGTKAAAPPPANALAPAENVREYNKVVLEARDEGPNRMRSLLTNFS